MKELDRNQSYLFGILITDGNLYLNTRNRGRVSLELGEKDIDLIKKLYDAFPGSNIHFRIRNTNFKTNYKTCIFTNTKREFRESLIKVGFPTTNKTLNACPPTVSFYEEDFWRGVIDGDGSIGVTAKGIPFVSLVTKSEYLKDAYLDYIKTKFGILKNINRNKRDGVYNILIMYNNSKIILHDLYNNCENSLFLNRKYEIAKNILLN